MDHLEAGTRRCQIAAITLIRAQVRAYVRLSGGFTLLEILVAMSLMSLIMLALGASLTGVAQSTSRVDARIAYLDDYRVAAAWVRSSLGRISARKVSAAIPEGASPFLFSGLAASVEWVGVMPARYGAGGRCFFRLAVEDTAEGRALVIRYQAWADVASFPEWSQADSRVLMTGVDSMQLQFENDRVNPPVWTSGWSERTHLPARVAITVNMADQQSRELLIPLRVLPGSDGAGQGDGTVVGGTAAR